MSISRIFQPIELTINSTIQLDEAATHHVARVLRAKVANYLTLFNGEGGEYQGIITLINKKSVTVEIKKFIDREVESPLELYLAQGISRGEKMDFTIQKAVELGVKKIIPLITERCNVKLDEERREKRLQHWSSIIIGACEQSGRNTIPEISVPQAFETFLQTIHADHKLVLTPHAQTKLSNISIPTKSSIVLLIGPEGGLSDKEVQTAVRHQFSPLQLGPRVLRTETAAIAAITALQYYAGDLSV